MAAILPASPPLPIFPSNPRARRLSTILPNLSRWNNANPQSSVAPLRLHRRYQSASNLLTPQNQRENDQQPPRPPPASKSKGTPSQPSSPSKPPTEARRKHQNQHQHQRHQHPAFRPFSAPALPAPCTGDGVSFKIEGAPFEFQYSYTETPKVKPVALRAPLFTPFGPQTMPRPWTGRAPLPKSRKKLPEFDSFRPPPPGMKGVKPVQLPGPFLPGSGPRYTVSREELLGEPLTEEEVKELVRGCMKTNRQLNIGRDGLTHNMLDNIHSHWKRRRVCKIKCKGVCTVDLDNVKHQLEEKTGGKVIHSSGGAMFLFRGRNYNYKTHPKFPLMLWKPTPPVYPRLVQRIPEGLTLEEATNMRKKGHQLPPICRLAKNGVYHKLVNDVREAFEVCELVRIDCTSLKSNDTRKIGAKLKDLVPCILMSFQFEHILLWRGKDWKSSLGLAKVRTTGPELVTDSTLSVDSCGPDRQIFTELVTDSALAVDSPGPDRQIFTELDTILDSEVDSFSAESCSEGEDVDTDNETLDSSEKASIVFDNIDDGAIGSLPGSWNEGTNCDDDKGLLNGTCNNIATGNSVPKGDECAQTGGNILESEENIVSEDLTIDAMLLNDNSSSMFSISNLGQNSSHTRSGATGGTIAMSKPEHSSSVESIATPGSTRLDGNDAMIARSGDVEATVNPNSIHIKNDKRRHCTDGIMALLKQAIENGRAVSLEGDSLDADLVYKSAVDLAKTAPPGPVFTHEYKKSANQIKKTDNGGAKKDNDQNQDQDIQPIAAAAAAKPTSKKGVRQKSKNEIKSSLPTIVPHGTLKVDELVKLLS